MPFPFEININKTAGGYEYEPAKLEQIAVGDQIIWVNNDDKPHWPGLLSGGTIKPTYFMPNQIAPNSPSDPFIPGDTTTPKPYTLTYVDSLDPQGPQGTIVVTR
jgi:plastocyanin